MPPKKTKPTLETYECSICCSDDIPIKIRNKSNRVVCPNCEQSFCPDCQRSYGRGDCMNCHLVFKLSFVVENLGKAFYDNVVKPKIIDELMVEQRDSLKRVQPLVDWEKEIRKQKKNLRFGIPMTIGERPSISKLGQKVENLVFPCPIQDCRGFVEKGICGLCKINVCLKCREKSEANHTCDMNTLMSISVLETDTKPCPKCCAGIHRTQGCNHMYCTQCRTHFDWVSGKILNTSTNGHYLHLQQYAQNVATRDISEEGEPIGCDDRGFSIYRPQVPFEDLDRTRIPEDILQCLWIDSNTIRLAKKKLYNEDTLDVLNIETLQEFQVKYLLGDIDEEHWKRNVFSQHKKYTLHRLYAQVFSIYLETVDRLQSATHNQTIPISEVKEQYRKLVELCNESFKSIQDEYGGQLHRIRAFDDDFLAPAFI